MTVKSPTMTPTEPTQRLIGCLVWIIIYTTKIGITYVWLGLWYRPFIQHEQWIIWLDQAAAGNILKNYNCWQECYHVKMNMCQNSNYRFVMCRDIICDTWHCDRWSRDQGPGTRVYLVSQSWKMEILIATLMYGPASQQMNITVLSVISTQVTRDQNKFLLNQLLIFLYILQYFYFVTPTKTLNHWFIGTPCMKTVTCTLLGF